ncbi:hypothetical protein DPMN_040018 [Dreissena polymorpha]|uniref:Uncharacterized protein n=1 Tax=Dreissena polymorpha TaxID=45954 RepID=A0A9D4CW32_DREPO|nr:hypothetical protein DPMN_040018 [Dreissena polymorpha]
MPSPKSEDELTAFINQFQLLKHLQTVEKDWNKIKGLAFGDDKQLALINIRHFTEWLLEERSSMTAQKSKVAECELGRLKTQYRLIMFQLKAKEREIQLDINIKTRICEAEHLLKGFDKYIANNMETCLDQLDKLNPKTCLGISDAERVMILQAISLPKVHWFKCPKGNLHSHN